MRSNAYVPLLVASLVCCRGAEAPHSSIDYALGPSESVETLTVLIDLPASARCEESLDFALYPDPGVVTIAWSPPVEHCRSRRAVVTFAPGRLSRAALVEKLRTLSVRLEVIES